MEDISRGNRSRKDEAVLCPKGSADPQVSLAFHPSVPPSIHSSIHCPGTLLKPLPLALKMTISLSKSYHRFPSSPSRPPSPPVPAAHPSPSQPSCACSPSKPIPALLCLRSILAHFLTTVCTAIARTAMLRAAMLRTAMLRTPNPAALPMADSLAKLHARVRLVAEVRMK